MMVSPTLPDKQADRSHSPAVTEHSSASKLPSSQRRGTNLGGEHALASLAKVVEESGISDYTVESVISKADPADYKQELARLGYVLNLNLKEENKDDSPTKTAKKMQVSIAAYTLDELL